MTIKAIGVRHYFTFLAKDSTQMAKLTNYDTGPEYIRSWPNKLNIIATSRYGADIVKSAKIASNARYYK